MKSRKRRNNRNNTKKYGGSKKPITWLTAQYNIPINGPSEWKNAYINYIMDKFIANCKEWQRVSTVRSSNVTKATNIKYVSFDTIKDMLKNIDINREELIKNKDGIIPPRAAKWLDNFYSEVAMVYIYSNNTQEYFENLEHRQNEFFVMYKQYLRSYVTCEPVKRYPISEGSTYYRIFDDQNYKLSFKSDLNPALNIKGTGIPGCDVLFNTKCDFTNYIFDKRHGLYDNLGNKLYDVTPSKKSDILLYIMDKITPSALNPDVVEEIMSYFPYSK